MVSWFFRFLEIHWAPPGVSLQGTGLPNDTIQAYDTRSFGAGCLVIEVISDLEKTGNAFPFRCRGAFKLSLFRAIKVSHPINTGEC